jgi:hypothetical protein
MTLLPFSATFVLFSLLGVRLLKSARETGGAELWLGCFFLAKGLVASQLGAWVALVALAGHRQESSAIMPLCNLPRALPFAWGFAESLRYHRLMKRRLEMNLANSVVANRFALFSIWRGALCVMPLVRATALAGSAVCFAALWLSFFPPHAYLERIQHAMQTS